MKAPTGCSGKVKLVPKLACPFLVPAHLYWPVSGVHQKLIGMWGGRTKGSDTTGKRQSFASENNSVFGHICAGDIKVEVHPYTKIRKSTGIHNPRPTHPPCKEEIAIHTLSAAVLVRCHAELPAAAHCGGSPIVTLWVTSLPFISQPLSAVSSAELPPLETGPA